MPFITASKSGPLNWLEGFALTAILQGFPIFAAASLMVKLLGNHHGGNPMLTITMATTFYSFLSIWAGSTFSYSVSSISIAGAVPHEPRHSSSISVN